MSESANEPAKTSANSPVFDSTTTTGQLTNFLVGLGSTLVGTVLALWFIEPGSLTYAADATGVARAGFHALFALVIGFAVHEAAHYLVGVAFDFDEVAFGTWRSNLSLSLTSLIWTLIAVSVIQFLYNPIPSITAFGVPEQGVRLLVMFLIVSVSPGGVILAARDRRRAAHEYTAIAGPLANLLLAGVGLLLVPDTFPAIVPSGQYGIAREVTIGLSLMVYGNLYLCWLNSLPLPGLDGDTAYMSESVGVRVLHVVCILAPIAILFVA